MRTSDLLIGFPPIEDLPVILVFEWALGVLILSFWNELPYTHRSTTELDWAQHTGAECVAPVVDIGHRRNLKDPY